MLYIRQVTLIEDLNRSLYLHLYKSVSVLNSAFPTTLIRIKKGIIKALISITSALLIRLLLVLVSSAACRGLR